MKQAQEKTLATSVLLLVGIGILVVGITTDVVSTTLFLDRWKEGAQQRVAHTVEMSARSVEGFLQRSQDIASQVASRSRARNLLMEFNAGRIEAGTYRAQSERILTDALNRSDHLRAVTRLDSRGALAAAVGEPVPPRFWPAQDGAEVLTSISGPFTFEGGQRIVVKAPILSRDGRQVGTDVTLFDLAPLTELLQAESQDPNPAYSPRLYLVARGRSGQLIFEPSRDGGAPLAPVQTAALAEGGELAEDLQRLDEGLVTLGRFLFAARRVEGSDWLILARQSTRALYHGVYKDTALSWGLSLLFSALGAVCILVIMRRFTSGLIDELGGLKSDVRAGEAKYRDLIEGSIQGIMIHRYHKPLLVNAAWADIHGYTVDEVMAMDSVLPLMAESDRDRMHRYSNARMKGEAVPYSYEYQAAHKSGALIWCQNLVSVIAWAGEPAIQSTIFDITERKDVEAQLKLRDRALESAVNGVLIVRADGDMPVVYANAAFERITGYTAEEALGRNSRFLQGDDRDQEELRKIREGIAARRPCRAVLRNYRKDGTLFWNQLQLAPVFDADGSVTHFVGIQDDITEQKQAEEALRQSEQRFRDVSNASSDWIWELDENMRFTYLSDRYREITGLSSQDAMGRSRLEMMGQDWKEDEENWTRHLDDMLSRRPFRDFRYSYLGPSGLRHYFSISGVPVSDSEGTFCGYRGTGTDLTNQVKAEESLRQAHKMEAMGQLTGGVAHDFNNLLTVILGNARLLERKLAKEEQLVKMAGAIGDAAKRGAGLVEHLLAFSRKQKLEPKVVDVGALIEGMRSLLSRALEAGIEIETAVSDETLTALVDQVQLEGAILNLSVNARDAMPNGGTLRIEVCGLCAREGEIPEDVTLEPDLDYIRILISDTGTGIPADRLKQIFEPFYTTKEVGKGTGLGLSMVFGFLQQSGGQVHVDSELGRGTTFRLFLPAAAADSERPDDSLGDRAGDSAGCETVLVVEDQAGVRELAAAVLQDLGYRVIEADNGPNARSVLEREPRIDLLFSDMVMPGGMSGLDLANVARQLHPDIKVLFTTGYSEEILSRDTEGQGSENLIAKPYEDKELSLKVREILDSRPGAIAG